MRGQGYGSEVVKFSPCSQVSQEPNVLGTLSGWPVAVDAIHTGQATQQ